MNILLTADQKLVTFGLDSLPKAEVVSPISPAAENKIDQKLTVGSTLTHGGIAAGVFLKAYG